MSSDRRPHVQIIAMLASLLPRQIRDEWRREWHAELDHHAHELQTWRVGHAGWRLFALSGGAIWDVAWLQRRRLEEDMVQDVRYAFRWLARSPVFAVAAILSLAIGIGANTAIFSLINAALIRPLPYPEIDRLVAVRTDQSKHFSVPGFVELAANVHALDHLTAVETSTFVLGDGRPEQIQGQLVSSEFATLVGLDGPLRPVVGRWFLPEEYRPGIDRVVVVSHRLWMRRYAGANDIVGRVISIDASPATVVGVLPANFDFFATGDLLAPLALGGARLNDRLSRTLEVIGRLRSDLGVGRAERIVASAMMAGPGEPVPVVHLDVVRDLLVQDFRRTLLTMWAVASLVLLIGCCNFANLLSARTLSRAHEFAVRRTLGAKRLRLTRQLATEAVILGTLGGLVGTALAVAGRNLLIAATSQHFLGASQIPFDGRVVVFAAVLALGSGLIFGLIPAIRAAGQDEGMPAGIGNASRSIRDLARAPQHGVSTLLASAEVGLTLALLVGASLLVKSMTQLERFQPGYNTAAMTLTFELPSTTYSDDAAVARFAARFREAMHDAPGTMAVGATSSLPMAESAFRFRAFTIENGPSEGLVGPPERLPLGFAPPPPPPAPPTGATVSPLRFFQAFSAETGPGFFDAMGIPVVRGRDFTEHDTAASQPVAIVNRAFADRYWPGTGAIGKRVRMTPVDPWVTVVGVVGNIRRFSRDDEIRSEMYRPFTQQGDRRRGDRLATGQPGTQMSVATVSFVVKTGAGPEDLRRSAQAALSTIDPAMPIARVSTLQADLEQAVAPRRFLLRLFFAFGIAALVLAALGVYGVTAYLARRRTREMAIRVALGATPRAVATLVVRQGLFIAVFGVVSGLVLAVSLSRLLRQYLYDVRPFDAGIYGGVAALLALVVLLASYVPARQAARRDPLLALKQE